MTKMNEGKELDEFMSISPRATHMFGMMILGCLGLGYIFSLVGINSGIGTVIGAAIGTISGYIIGRRIEISESKKKIPRDVKIPL